MSAVPHCVEHGLGVPVLAIHGWTVDHRLMTGCLEPVFLRRPGYRRIYPDLPGMGRSPAPKWIASADDVLSALQDLIDQRIGTDRFAVIGESYGGYLARAVANARRTQVLGLALICPVGLVLEKSRRAVPARTVLVRDPDLTARLDPAEATEFTEHTVVESAETWRRFREDVLPGIQRADQAALRRLEEHWELRVAPENGPAYPGPTLIMTGRQDSVVGYSDVYPLLDHYPRASLAILDRAGHNLQFEQPALFESLLAEWLDRVDATSNG